MVEADATGSVPRFLRVERWRLDYMFGLGFQGWLIHTAVVSLLALALAILCRDLAWPVTWYAFMLPLSLIVAALCRAASRPPVTGEGTLQRMGVAHTALTGLIGITWGLGAFGAAAENFDLLLIYSLALGGTALGAVASQHAVPRSALVSIWTSVPLLAAAHLAFDSSVPGFVNAGLMLLYGGILSVLMIRMQRFLRANVELNRKLDRKIADLTAATRELDLARREAEQANLTKSRFLAQASHDLRQPVHAISLFTACLRDAGLSRENRQIVEHIDRSLDSVGRLFKSLLDISALDVGKVVPQIRPTALAPVLEGVARQFADRAAAAGGSLSWRGTGASVRTDPAILETMVQNLVSNAVKYAPGARILVGCRRRGGRLAVEVHDQGNGIGRDDLDRVFDEFYRTGDSQARRQDGLGLGLSIVQRMARLMDLSVSIRSYPGRGTCVAIEGFETVSALGDAPAPTEPARTAPVPTHPLAGRRILLIDNDQAILEATGALFERWGCEVDGAASVPDAGQGDGAGWDLVVTDLDLGGGLTGADCIAEVRRRAGRDVPAVVITGLDDDAVQAARLDRNVPVVAKPLRPAELRSIITAQLVAAPA